MNLLEKAAANQLKKTRERRKLSIRNQIDDKYDVYAIPLKYLYYNDQNGRINTMYKKYSSVHGLLTPEAGDSEYNKIFEKFICESNNRAMQDTKDSMNEKSQQEPGVVLPDGRVIDGNRRFTALRMLERETGISQEFNAIILDLNSKFDEKIIKELELDLQFGREERVSYDPIDRIFDVYNTIEVEKMMTIEEYIKASGSKDKRKIKRYIRFAELIIKFIKIVSPGGNPIDKFYIARELKLDGPIEDIEGTISKLKSKNRESIIEAILVYLAVSKTVGDQNDSTRVMRALDKNVMKNKDLLEYFVKSVDDKIDIIMETFEENPIQSANDLKTVIEQNKDVKKSVDTLMKTADKLVIKGKIENKRRAPLVVLESVKDSLLEINTEDFSELTPDENLEAKVIIDEIKDVLYRLKKGI